MKPHQSEWHQVKMILNLALLFASSLAYAEPAYLYTETSKPGETMDDFVIRITPRAVEYTKQHDVEVCAAIGKLEGLYTMRVKTDNDPWVCKVTQVQGEFTGQLFHTHTERGNDGWAPADLKVPGYLATPRKLLWQDENRMKKLSSY